MNEFGIDSLSLAQYMPLTQAMVDQIQYMIQKSGISSGGGPDIGTPAYFNQTMTTFQYFEQNVQLMQQNNKPIGAYFFSYAWDYASGKYEAELMCDSISQLAHRPDWPIFMDWEQDSYDKIRQYYATPTASMVHDAVAGWIDGCRGRGYLPGFYTGGALARDLFGNSWIQQQRAAGLYFWEAHYTTAPQPMVTPCDIWQYDAGPNNTGVSWMGTVVDFNRIMDDRMWNIGPGPSGGIPIWLKIKLAQGGDKRGKHTILL